MQSPSKFQLNSSPNYKGQFANSSGITEIPRIAKAIPNDKRTSGGTTLPDLKLYYRVIVGGGGEITAWYWYSDR